MSESSPRWRVYYADGSTIDSAETEWRALPAEGVVGVVVFDDPPYRVIVDGGDWYYLDADCVPTTTATADAWGEWVDPPDVRDADRKRGAGLPDTEWTAVKQAMVADRSWP